MGEASEVIHNPERHRFEVRIEGQLAQTAYEREGNVITFTHTFVPESLSGHGIAKHLAQSALEYARENNLSVVPLCPFVAAYIKRHPEYEPLVLKE